MKKFLIRIISFVAIPIVVLVIVYLITDPFKTLRPFSLNYYDETNRDYLSSELFLRNDSIFHYNSFIFGSSRCTGFNTYHWKYYLPMEARQYLFQAWSETLTGIEQKIDYLDKNGNSIDNALVLLDIPGTFAKEQMPKTVLHIKHYRFSGQSKITFQCWLFYGFIQRPPFWLSSVKRFIRNDIPEFPTDTFSNDWGYANRKAVIKSQPIKDSLRHCTVKSKADFIKLIENKSDADLRESKPLITKSYLKQLKHIKAVFDKHHTDYRIIVSPAYCYTHPSINADDLRALQIIFGKDKIFDYSGKNEITVDCYNFSDPEHFGQSVGWQIIEDIYNSKHIDNN